MDQTGIFKSNLAIIEMVIFVNESIYVEEMLNGINMGMIAMDHLIDKIKSHRMRDIVVHQRKRYGDLKDKIMQTCSIAQDEVKHQFMVETMIEMKTILTDDSKIAKMLIEGNNQAIMTMSHLMNKADQVSMKMKNYENDFEEMAQSFIDSLKQFL